MSGCPLWGVEISGCPAVPMMGGFSVRVPSGAHYWGWRWEGAQRCPAVGISVSQCRLLGFWCPLLGVLLPGAHYWGFGAHNWGFGARCPPGCVPPTPQLRPTAATHAVSVGADLLHLEALGAVALGHLSVHLGGPHGGQPHGAAPQLPPPRPTAAPHTSSWMRSASAPRRCGSRLGCRALTNSQ